MISLCKSCYCMTKTLIAKDWRNTSKVWAMCGKCKKKKDDNVELLKEMI